MSSERQAYFMYGLKNRKQQGKSFLDSAGGMKSLGARRQGKRFSSSLAARATATAHTPLVLGQCLEIIVIAVTRRILSSPANSTSAWVVRR